jgi:hypothetical protein
MSSGGPAGHRCVPHREPDATVVLFRGEAEVARWLLSDCRDLAVVDALARLQLAARPLGYVLRLRHPDGELVGLIDLVGLAGVLPVMDG